DGVELARVPAEPALRRQVLRVEQPAPMLVDPPGTADPYRGGCRFVGHATLNAWRGGCPPAWLRDRRDRARRAVRRDDRGALPSRSGTAAPSAPARAAPRDGGGSIASGR